MSAKEKILLELSKSRAKFIDAKQDSLEDIGTKMENKLFDMILEKFMNLLEENNGQILFNEKNIAASDAIEKIFEDFAKSDLTKFAQNFAVDINKVTDLNIQYYRTLLETKKRFDRIATDVKKIMRVRLGVDANGKLIRNGYLDSFIRDTGLKSGVRKIILDAVTKQTSSRDLIRALKQNIKGIPEKNVPGAIKSKLINNVFDIYQQHDRAISKNFSQEFGLKAFRYVGGIIETSREFCIERNGKIFTVDEALKWVDDPLLPRTTAEVKSGVVSGYDPLLDCGRWRCRHHINYISNAMAKKLRPDLVNVL